MSEPVLDSSAVLALLFGEPGSEFVKDVLPNAVISAVNVAEIVTTLCEKGMPIEQALLTIEALGLDIVDFNASQAFLAGELRLSTRSLGLSLGDRSCLALAKLRNEPAVTADRAWRNVQGFNVILIRGEEQ